MCVRERVEGGRWSRRGVEAEAQREREKERKKPGEVADDSVSAAEDIALKDTTRGTRRD